MAKNKSSLDGVDNYLNEKLRTHTDLDNLDALLKNLQDQQELQRKQLREAENILEHATKASNEHAETVYNKTQAFNKEQEDIDFRLMLVTQSDTSDEAVKKFEASMDKLRRLDVAKGYMELLSTADRLSEEASTTIHSSPRGSLSRYTQLRNIASELRATQPSADGAAPHVVEHVGRMADNLRTLIAKEYTTKLEAVLAKIKWPAQSLNLANNLVEEWSHWCELLLDLQGPELVAEARSPEGRAERQHPVLLPLEVMARPLELRFKYHFSGDKPTNRLDKPEYFLSHIIDLINAHHEFFASHFQPILNKKLRASSSQVLKASSDAVSSYITSLFPILRQKIQTILPQIANQPQLLSHFMHELMNFDNEIRETWGYAPGEPEDIWKGLTWEVLVSQDWFNKWLQVEKDFALTRYHNIVDATDSGEIDYDGIEHGTTKPTKAAIRVNDLLETITERYQPLSSFSQKIRFLIEIQIAIFDMFHERLHSSLEAYLAMTSTIGRTVGGSGSQPSLEGVAGLERLCRVFGSAEYLEKKMQDWSDDVFFLELWYELQDRVDQNTHTGRPVAGPMSVSDVAARTSSSVVQNDNGVAGDKAEGALFDETASAYGRLRVRSESVIVSALISGIRSTLRPYSRVSTWASLSTSPEESVSTPSFDVANAIRALSAELAFLSRAVAAAPLRRITRQLLLAIQTYLWDNVLLRNSFSSAGAAQLALDINAICGAIDAAVGVPEGEGKSERIMQKLKEGVSLLGLRAKQNHTGGTAPDLEGGSLKPSESRPSDGLDLWEVEKRIFESNESARSVLAQLGTEMLTEAEARAILERRVELQGMTA